VDVCYFGNWKAILQEVTVLVLVHINLESVSN